jgi:hypothetical protein
MAKSKQNVMKYKVGIFLESHKKHQLPHSDFYLAILFKTQPPLAVLKSGLDQTGLIYYAFHRKKG